MMRRKIVEAAGARARRRPPRRRGRARSAPAAPCAPRTAASRTGRPGRPRSGCWPRCTPSGLLGPVERQQHQAGHDGGQGEGHVDDHLEDALAREVVAHQHPGDEGAHHHVDERSPAGPARPSAAGRRPSAGCVRVFQNSAHPPPAALTTTAARGMQDEQAEPEHRDARARARGPASGRQRGEPTPARGRSPDRVRAGVEGASRLLPVACWIVVMIPVFCVEELLSAAAPAAEVLVDGEQVLRRAGNGCDGSLAPLPSPSTPAIDRAEALLGEDRSGPALLTHEVEELLAPSGRPSR